MPKESSPATARTRSPVDVPAVGVHAVPAVRPARIAELDGIRGIAVLAVVGYHLFFFSQQQIALDWTGLPLLVWIIAKQGWTGIHLFFVLSGFLITGILLNSKDRPHYYRDFYARRAIRILPAYFATLSAVYLIIPAAGSFVLLSAVFLSNLTPLFGVPIVYSSLWTLAVEEHFYIVWPWFVDRFNRRDLLKAIGVLLLLGPILRALRMTLNWEETFYSWYGFDSLLWGAVLALVYDNGRVANKTLLRLSLFSLCLGAAGFAVGAPFGILTRKSLLGTVFQLPCLDFVILGFLGAVLASQGKAWTSPLRSRLMTTFGVLSYSLYLVHCLVIYVIENALAGHTEFLSFRVGTIRHYVTLASVEFLICCLVAMLCYRFIETPALRYRNRFKS